MGKISVRLWQFVRRAPIALLSTAFVLSTVIAGTVAFLPLAGTATLAASTCPQNSTPQYNIIYCGLSGPSTANYISSLQGYYNSNNDGHGNSDIQTVLNWAGASPAMIAGMNTSNTVVGTAYSNGTITVNGQLVGTGSIVAGRWNPGGSGFTHLEGNVWYRNATTSFAPTPQVQVLVHLNSSGQADFAVMIVCGNVLKFMPTPPPKKVITCLQLTDSEVDSSLAYNFTAKAAAQNIAITGYTFNFGDGSKQTVPTSSTSATANHTYTSYNTTYTANVYVNGETTSSACQVHLTTPPPPAKPTLTCIQLTSTPAANSTTQYTFTVQASAFKTKIISYTFNFGDNVVTTIPTNSQMISVSHTYASPNTYHSSVTVNGEHNLTATSGACTASVTVAATPPPSPTPPAQLLNTGPGDIGGIFGATAIVGALFHHFFMRRKVIAGK